MTRAALSSAVETKPDLANWMLPIVVGGDDVTAVMDARLAFAIPAPSWSAFEVESRRSVIIEVLTTVSEGRVVPGGDHCGGDRANCSMVPPDERDHAIFSL